jgi:predicted peptidase
VPQESGFLDRSVNVGGQVRRYVVYVPPDDAPDREWPAILALHGKGESGTDGLFQLWHGLGRAIVRNRGAWPLVAIFPQKADPEALWPDELPLLEAVLIAADREFKLDPARRYLTGLSQGGHGTAVLASRLPWTFAALAPVCGWADDPEAAAQAIGRTPLWAFHGELDTVIPLQRSAELVEAIQRNGGAAKLTAYPDVGHDSWHRAYQDEALAEWLLGQKI